MPHWTEQQEQKGSLWGMTVVLWLYRKLGSVIIGLILHPIVLLYFLFATGPRRISRNYLQRVFKQQGHSRKPKLYHIYRHIYAFSFAMIEKVVAWMGELRSTDLKPQTAETAQLAQRLADKQGAVILCSHLGNIEMLRAMAYLEKGLTLPDFEVYSVADFSGTARFNSFMRSVNPNSMVQLIDAKTINPSTIIFLQEKITQGNLVVIAGDRTVKTNRKRNTKVNFLGAEAQFPQGAFLLAILLDAPVYFMFALKERELETASPYLFYAYQSKIATGSNKGLRRVLLERLTKEYVQYLETLCIQHPYQWYNFFDFWELI